MANALPPFNEQWDELIAMLDEQRTNQPRRWFRWLVFHDRHRTSYWVLRQLNLWGVPKMARGVKKAVQKPTNGKQAWTTFVEISLAGHDMASIDEAYPTPDDVFDAIQDMVTEGNRISLSHNEQNDSIIASVTCKDDDSVNAGCTYTSFAGDWYTALKIAAYKHTVVSERNWSGSGGENTRPMFG